MQNTESFKARLQAMKQHASHRIKSIDRDIRHEGMTADWSEQAIERENDEVLQSLGNAAAQEVLMINAALQRIESGDYFICSQCGDDIPKERLELLPFSTLCVACAEKLESQ